MKSFPIENDATSMIEFIDVTLVKNGVSLFQNFSFKILPGENWVIQGGNGSGKTLFLQLAAGALHPTSGKIRYTFLEETDWSALYRERQEKIHFIPTHWLHAFLSEADGSYYQQRYYSIADSQVPTVRSVLGDDVEKLSSLGISPNFNIQNLLHLHITRLSNGQLKKVVILRQLIRNLPRILLLDYPFDGLDAESRQDFSAFIDDIATRFAIQVVLVDHGNVLPEVMNRKLTLRKCGIHKIEHTLERSQRTQGTPAWVSAKSEGSPVVEMKNVTIQYGEKKIIENLNWQINKGERWALTGKNGSGKTTLFSLIYADHPMAYSQHISLFGRRRGTGESIWDIKKRINYFGPEQIHFLNPNGIALTARQYILMRPHKDPDQLNNLVDLLDAGTYIDRPIRHLSSGQLQLILLINLFLDDKELLLLDEPFQFLDPENQDRLTQYLNHYLSRDITLVLITHDEKDVIRWTQNRKTI
jgi:molybdate transport system ATP-binding protein